MSVVRAAPAPGELEGLSDRHRWVVLLGEAGQLAHAIANTNFVPKGLRGDEAAITAAILYGDEIGLPPMQALAKVAVIDGRPAIAAEAQRALITAAGHTLWFEDFTSAKVTWCGRRSDTGVEQRVTWTHDQARIAGLTGKDNWRKYPRAMLSARASADLARAVFADVIGGLAAIEELDDGAGPAGELEAPEPATPPKASSRRRRTTRPIPQAIAPAPPGPPDAEPGPPLPGEGDPAPEQASEQQRRKLFALFNEHGIADRLERLAWVNERLERVVTSSLELTAGEASALIDELEALPAYAGERYAAEPAESDDEPAEPVQGELEVAEPDDVGEQILDVTPERLTMLQWARGEAGVDDDWLRARLEAIGLADVPAERITKATLGRLSQAQAKQLLDELSTIIEQRDAGE